MSNRTTPWPAGTPCWADIAPPDATVARAFYAAVLGWTWDEPRPDLGNYANARVGGEAVVGMMDAPAGAPPAWTLYFATDDADATAAAIMAHGGVVHVGPMDVTDLGRMVVAQDPAGAVFGLWQAGTHIGTRVYGEPGAIAWEDLRSTDPAAAQAFYTAVLGVEVRPLAMAGPDYGTFHLAGDLAGSDAPLGGMGGMMGAAGGSRWSVYFAVADVDAAAGAAIAAGGAVETGPMDTPYGPMAGLTDPGGAGFWVVAPTAPNPDRPER